MPVYNASAKSGGSSTEDRQLLETDVYRMKIVESAVEENKLGQPNKDGTFPLQQVVTWEVSGLLPEQEGDNLIGTRCWQRINFFYGDVKDGGPSKFKAFIQAFQAQGYLQDFDPAAYDPDILVGIEQRVSVQQYIKTMGPNAGQPGNKIVGVMPLKRSKPAAPAAQSAPRKNVPQPVTADGADEDLF